MQDQWTRFMTLKWKSGYNLEIETWHWKLSECLNVNLLKKVYLKSNSKDALSGICGKMKVVRSSCIYDDRSQRRRRKENFVVVGATINFFIWFKIPPTCGEAQTQEKRRNIIIKILNYGHSSLYNTKDY